MPHAMDTFYRESILIEKNGNDSAAHLSSVREENANDKEKGKFWKYIDKSIGG